MQRNDFKKKLFELPLLEVNGFQASVMVCVCHKRSQTQNVFGAGTFPDSALAVFNHQAEGCERSGMSLSKSIGCNHASDWAASEQSW